MPSTTPHTDTAQSEAHAPLALLAIATHVVTNRLPMPSTIMAPNSANDHQVEIWIRQDDLGGWLASGDVELGEQTVEPMTGDYAGAYVTVVGAARFTATGLGFTMRWAEETRQRADRLYAGQTYLPLRCRQDGAGR